MAAQTLKPSKARAATQTLNPSEDARGRAHLLGVARASPAPCAAVPRARSAAPGASAAPPGCAPPPRAPQLRRAHQHHHAFLAKDPLWRVAPLMLEVRPSSERLYFASLHSMGIQLRFKGLRPQDMADRQRLDQDEYAQTKASLFPSPCQWVQSNAELGLAYSLYL